MPKNIVICCDGTNNQFGDHNTNVVRLFEALDRSDEQQCVFYEPGVGTFPARFAGFNVGTALGKLLGSAFGYGVRRCMSRAYRYLMNVYAPGDKVFIFGFSRGAFIARSLAGLLISCGVLEAHQDNLVPYVTAEYLDHKTTDGARRFRKTFGRPCHPHLIGVWDTVGALGLLLSLRTFEHNRLSPHVANALHAMAIDEKRFKFQVTPWDTRDTTPDQDVRQVWFAGVHSDVGGGFHSHGLADIALGWMLENAAAKGLKLKAGSIEAVQGDPLGVKHRSCKGLWRLHPAPRKIPENAVIHPSVTTRLNADVGYAPANLPQRD